MHIVGTVAEYNPFHNGHLYHLEKIKEMFPDALIILILSGNFTQRGNVSILDKWQKTDIALTAGVDLVVELPFPFATGAADIFAEGALGLCQELGVTDFVFGSESNDMEGIQRMVEEELNNPDFPSLVQVYLRMGNNYPTALSLALQNLTGIAYRLPNDLLGISYVKAILKHHYPITPHTIQRTTVYHDVSSQENIASATSIRSNLANHISIAHQVPTYTLDYLNDKIVQIDDYFKLLQYRIVIEPDLTKFQLVDSGMAQRLKQQIMQVTSIDELIKSIKGRNVTYNRIARMLLYILCGYTKQLDQTIRKLTYLRLLGFSTKGQAYLNEHKKNFKLPLISKFKRNKDLSLTFECQVSTIYALAFACERQTEIIKSEYAHAPIRKDE